MKKQIVIFIAIFLFKFVYPLKSPLDIGKNGLPQVESGKNGTAQLQSEIRVITRWYLLPTSVCNFDECAIHPCNIDCSTYRDRCCKNAEGLQKCVCGRTLDRGADGCGSILNYIKKNPTCGVK
ncbi:uncharacterized protein BX664DRAFT_310181 [Halteromyces radiatus]|uniref:uncharacterized protein n=1 Tax=Halteromyces radiatus TaxID=101107 RepID=UPI00221FF730|nr:uncharacterized protein BX664DRAFT_310181 [Halteromyces radiatus]KAI8099186.1 hypothetical protein BX664DRAFT_310181 [Halteromyces radiatus]